jgi:hypothetical protein
VFNKSKKHTRTGHDVIHALLATVSVQTAGRRRLFWRKVVLRILQNLGHAFEQGEIAATNVIVMRCMGRGEKGREMVVKHRADTW